MEWRRFFVLLAALVCAGVVGCASWDTPPTEAKRLPQPRLTPDAVVLEISFIRLPTAQVAVEEAIWKQADELHLPAELRRQMAENGFRCGVLGEPLPAELRQLLAATPDIEEAVAEAPDPSRPQRSMHRRIHCRTGKRSEVIASKQFDSLALLTHHQGAVRGGLYEAAQCLFELKPYPRGDGRVEIGLTPEIQHGAPKQQWVSQQNSLVQRVGREQLRLEWLQQQTALAPGQVLMLGATPEPRGVGEHFFVESTGGQTERLTLLIRVAQTQHDDLFAPDLIAEPIVTPAEQ